MTPFPVAKEALIVWYDVAIEIYKISLLDTLNQILIKGKVLGDYVFDTKFN